MAMSSGKVTRRPIGIVNRKHWCIMSELSHNQQDEHFRCLYPDRWQEEKDFKREIRDWCVRVEHKIDSLTNEHGDLHKRVFVGNGQPALFPRVIRLEQVANAAIWVSGVLVTAVVALFFEIWKAGIL